MASHRKPHHQRITLGMAIATAAAVVLSVGVLSIVSLARPDRPSAPKLRSFWTAIVQDSPVRALPHPKVILTAEATSIVVRKGDTLSSISKHVLGNSNLWPELWLRNRQKVPNPNMLRIGVHLHFGTRHHVRAWVVAKALAAIPKPKPAPAAVSPIQVTTVAAAPAPVAQAYSSQLVSSYSGSGGFQSCVISRESGGNPDAWNPNGHYGLYQFSAGTWAANGGNPADFGHASVAEQNQVFSNTMTSGGGASNWSPYDGC